eukprot:TRINITY_DN15388_c0_g1_i1.p1 TRINITY_DN15388_c0_g1~~TRINITY_DN15388_c0_g1_i1.p1  ORF type:complete len:1761 (+),score=747.13 TRINITY_DN15388_c0_g1_i1:218-5284(+)
MTLRAPTKRVIRDRAMPGVPSQYVTKPDPAWLGANPRYAAEFQFALKSLQGGGKALSLEFWQDGAFWDDRVGSAALPLPSTEPASLWEMTDAAQEREFTLDIQQGSKRAAGAVRVSITVRGGDAMKQDVLYPEFYVGTKVVPNLRVFGIAAGGDEGAVAAATPADGPLSMEEQLKTSRVELRVRPLEEGAAVDTPDVAKFIFARGDGTDAATTAADDAAYDKYRVNEWKWVKKNPEYALRRLVGEVVATDPVAMTVDVRWLGDPNDTVYSYTAMPAFLDVLPIEHAKQSKAVGQGCEWSPLDYYQVSQLRHSHKVLEQMYAHTQRKLAKYVQALAMESDISEATKQEVEDLVYNAELSRRGWLALYAVLHAFEANWECLAKEREYSYAYSWDDQATPVQRAMIRALFDRTFPARHRYAIFKAAGLAGALQLDGSPVCDGRLRQLVDGWKHGTCEVEDLQEVEAALVAWTGTLAASKMAKMALDSMMNGIVGYLHPEGVARSVVLSRTFMCHVVNDAARFMRLALSDLALPQSLMTLPDAAEVKAEIATLLAPHAEGGPWVLVTLMENINNIYMLYSSEALEEYIDPSQGREPKSFVADLKELTKRERSKPVLTRKKPTSGLYQNWMLFKAIEAKFGIAVSEFFKLMLYLITVNFFCFILWFWIVVFPWALWAEEEPHVTVDHGKAWLNLIGFGTNFSDYNKTHLAAFVASNGTAVAGGESFLFPTRAMAEGNYWWYGAYPATFNGRAFLAGSAPDDHSDWSEYRVGAAYTACIIFSFMVAFVLFAAEMVSRKRRDFGTNTALDEYTARWARALERKADDGLMHQRRVDTKALEPATREQAEKLGRLKMLGSNHLHALYSFDIGLNNPKGRATKVEAAGKYWQLQYDLYGFKQSMPMDDWILLLQKFLNVLGSLLCLIIFSLGIFLLTYIEDRQKELVDYWSFLPGLLVNCVVSSFPLMMSMVVEMVEIHYDEAFKTYKSIGVAFAATMSSLVYITIRYMDQQDEVDHVCPTNNLAAIYYNLTVTAFAVGCVSFFAVNSLKFTMNYSSFYPDGVATIHFESMLLRVPVKYFPSADHDVRVNRLEDAVTVTFLKDAHLVARELYLTVADIIRGGAGVAVKESAGTQVDIEKNSVLGQQAALAPACRAEALDTLKAGRDAVENARADMREAVTAHFANGDEKDTVLRLAEQRLDTLSSDELLSPQVKAARADLAGCLPGMIDDALNADRAANFETMMTTMSAFKDNRAFQKVYKEFEALARKKETFASWKYARVPLMHHLDLDAHWFPSATGVSGYHYLPDSRPLWMSAPHMALYDSHGEFLRSVRTNMATDAEEKKLKFLEEQIKHLRKELEELDEQFEEMRQHGTDEQQQAVLVQISLRVFELCRLMRFFVYLAQKLEYTQRVNLFTHLLNTTKKSLPTESGHQEINLPSEVLQLIHLQSLIWITSLFSPMALGHGALVLALFFAIRLFTYARLISPPKKPLAIGANSYFFYAMIMMTLLCCLVPTAAFFYKEQTCGPHLGTSPVAGMWDWIGDWPYVPRRIMVWAFEPYVLMVWVVLFFTVAAVLTSLFLRAKDELAEKNRELASMKVLTAEKIDSLSKFADSLRTQQRSRVLADHSDKSGGGYASSDTFRLRLTNNLSSTLATMNAEVRGRQLGGDGDDSGVEKLKAFSRLRAIADRVVASNKDKTA